MEQPDHVTRFLPSQHSQFLLLHFCKKWDNKLKICESKGKSTKAGLSGYKCLQLLENKDTLIVYSYGIYWNARESRVIGKDAQL